MSDKSFSMSDLPQLPTWIFSICKTYYPAEEANAKIQELEKIFNHSRLQMRSYVEAMEEIVRAMTLTISGQEKIIGEQAIRIEELKDKISFCNGLILV